MCMVVLSCIFHSTGQAYHEGGDRERERQPCLLVDV